MHANVIVNYMDKIYGFAVNNTFSREEADELSQEILLTALRQLPTLRADDCFEPWLWQLAKNVANTFRRSQGKQRAMYSYDTPVSVFADDIADEENEELYALLRSKIAMLSSIYRDIVILYYYDGLSVKTIAERLRIPEGTVTWRLAEARKKLKKECETMEEIALRPVKLSLGFYGSGNFDGKIRPYPTEFISDALSQNILFYCADEPKTVETLAKLCGVPAYYIEDRIAHLLRYEAIKEAPKGKYLTDFVIWTDRHGKFCTENAEKAVEPIREKMLSALSALAKDAAKLTFYRAEKSEDELFYLYGALVFEYLEQHHNTLPSVPIREKYDGARWAYSSSVETGTYRRLCFTRLRCANQGSRGSYMHTVYGDFAGFSRRDMMYDNYINVCEDLLTRGSTEDLDAATNAICEGYIERRGDGSLFVTVPAFTKMQYAQFCELIRQHIVPLAPEYAKLVETYAAGYKKLFPKHLADVADYWCSELFFMFYRIFAEAAQRSGLAKCPENRRYCDVLVQIR